MVYLFKCIITNSDSNINIKRHVQETRTSTQGVLLDVPKCKTAAFQNSYYIRAANVWNTLPCCIRDTNKTLVSFKVSLKRHYKDLTSVVYNPEDPRTFKSVCVKCHTTTDLIVDWIELPYLSKVKPIFMRAFYFRGPKGVNSIWRK